MDFTKHWTFNNVESACGAALQGTYTDQGRSYLRWCDESGHPMAIGDEKAELNGAEAAEARAETMPSMVLGHRIDPRPF